MLAEQYRDKRLFSLDYRSAPRTLEEAYQVQEPFQDIPAQIGGPVAGVHRVLRFEISLT